MNLSKSEIIISSKDHQKSKINTNKKLETTDKTLNESKKLETTDKKLNEPITKVKISNKKLETTDKTLNESKKLEITDKTLNESTTKVKISNKKLDEPTTKVKISNKKLETSKETTDKRLDESTTKVKISNEKLETSEELTDKTLDEFKIKSSKKISNNRTLLNIIDNDIITYNNNKYIVCCIQSNDKHILFIVDYIYKDEITTVPWYYSNNYISCNHYDENNIKRGLFLHNYVMNKFTFDGKGQQETIDHINRIKTDNRLCNLRKLNSQSEQNFNQKLRDRKIVLPEDCGFTSSDIPKNIYYGKPNGKHGDYFYIQIKGVPSITDKDRYEWKSTRIKTISLKIKLQMSIDHLLELKEKYPELENIIIDNENENIIKESIDDYNNILKLSRFSEDIINDNLREFKSSYKLIDIIDDNEINEYKKNKKIKDAGKKVNNLPENCNITIDMIPKYCYFSKETESRGCKFVIDKHPKLTTRQWSTNGSKKVSIDDKYKQLMDKIAELNQN